MRIVPVLVVALLLVLAGCAAPVSDPGNPGSDVVTETPTETPAASDQQSPDDGENDEGDGTNATDGDDETAGENDTHDASDPEELAAQHDIETEDELPVDAELVFARVQFVMNERDARPPDRVQVFGENRMQLGGGEVSHFRELVGITYPEDEELIAAGYVDGPDRIVLNAELLNDTEQTETVVAHEAVHVIQYEQDAFATTTRNVGDDNEFRGTVDAGLTYQAVIEGTAVYAETAYWEEYDGNGTPPNERMEELYYSNEGAMRLGIGPYYWGAEHVADRVTDSTEFETIYENPPRTTSELIHGVDEDEPPVSELEVEGDETGDWEAVEMSRDRKGELYVRVALASELSDETAAEAGTGWRNDQRLSFSNGTNRSYVWALRFDDAENASVFEEALHEFVDARGEPESVPHPDGDGEITVWRSDDPDASYRVERVGDDTVVLILGDHAFVDETEVDGDDGEVHVESP